MSETRQLILRYLGGDTDPALIQELDRRLREDPKVGVLFAELAGLEHGLYAVSAEHSQAYSASDEPELISEDLPLALPRPISRTRRRSNTLWSVGMALAACLVLGVLLVFATRSTPIGGQSGAEVADKNPNPKTSEQAPETPRWVQTPEPQVDQPAPTPIVVPAPAPVSVVKNDPAPQPVVTPKSDLAPSPAPVANKPEPKPLSIPAPAPSKAVPPIEAIARLTHWSKSARLYRAGKRVMPSLPADLTAEDVITTESSDAADFAARLVYADGTRLDVMDDSELQLHDADGAKHVELRAGRLACKVMKQPVGQSMKLTTKHARSIVLGTQFTLTALADRTVLDVSEGRVQFEDQRNGRHMEVAAGLMAEVGPRTPMTLRRGTPGSETGLMALYRFDEGKDQTVRDQSGVAPALDLAIENARAVRWERDGGLTVRLPVLIASSRPAEKIALACRASNAVSIEAWIKTLELDAATSQIGEDRIVTISESTQRRNITLGQGAIGFDPSTYSLRLRTDANLNAGTVLNGLKPMVTPGGLARKSEWRHLVFTRDAMGQATLWVNGQIMIQQNTPGTLKNWDVGYRLALGREVTANEDSAAGQIDPRNADDLGRSWFGTYRWVAIYAKALSAEQVKAYFEAGPGD